MATTNVTDQTRPAAEQAVYVGPRPFRTGQKLYGRDREAAQLISLLISQRLVLRSGGLSGRNGLAQPHAPRFLCSSATPFPLVGRHRGARGPVRRIQPHVREDPLR